MQNLNITKIKKNIEKNKKLISFFFKFSISNLFFKKKAKFLDFADKQINKKDFKKKNLIKIFYLLKIAKSC